MAVGTKSNPSFRGARELYSQEEYNRLSERGLNPEFISALSQGPQGLETALGLGLISELEIQREGSLSPDLKESILGSKERNKAQQALATAQRNAPGISRQTALPGTRQATVLNIR